MRVRVGLLVCDHVRPEFRSVAGDYADMFAALLGPEVELRAYDLPAGEEPASLAECSGWVTTGSRRSVYEDEPWIHRLAALTRGLHEGGHRLVGVCFGHQMIAHALGGRVARSGRGWGVGIKQVAVTRREPWMDPPATSFRVLNSHADQVETLPPGGRVLGGNDHCPVSLLAMDDHLLGIQGHPEFDPAYSRALMESRRGTLIPDRVVDEALAGLDAPPDRELLAGWIRSFLAGRR
jgi:GMP synthase (glutamine-hydrolysing)